MTGRQQVQPSCNSGRRNRFFLNLSLLLFGPKKWFLYLIPQGDQVLISLTFVPQLVFGEAFIFFNFYIFLEKLLMQFDLGYNFSLRISG